ncbi:hypothetical protein AX777_04810 [Sphingobium yanoikuyae]|uniref:Uncharacterized protein n=1 Tax=Sphingobium yanoikuyae TaxID=13690 RepID=A0A177JP67_SPHYA|nr:hypothetical protein AX777_04810 [Sphingobium yanoikuyae]
MSDIHRSAKEADEVGSVRSEADVEYRSVGGDLRIAHRDDEGPLFTSDLKSCFPALEPQESCGAGEVGGYDTVCVEDDIRSIREPDLSNFTDTAFVNDRLIFDLGLLRGGRPAFLMVTGHPQEDGGGADDHCDYSCQSGRIAAGCWSVRLASRR